MQPLYLTGSSIVSALGAGLERTFAALREGRSGLRPNDFEPFPPATWIGRIDGVESAPISMHGRENSISLTLPPLSTLILKREPHG